MTFELKYRITGVVNLLHGDIIKIFTCCRSAKSLRFRVTAIPVSTDLHHGSFRFAPAVQGGIDACFSTTSPNDDDKFLEERHNVG